LNLLFSVFLNDNPHVPGSCNLLQLGISERSCSSCPPGALEQPKADGATWDWLGGAGVGEELDADLGGNADFGLNIMLEIGRFESQSTLLFSFFLKVASCR
jgi:hypothetical protein